MAWMKHMKRRTKIICGVVLVAMLFSGIWLVPRLRLHRAKGRLIATLTVDPTDLFAEVDADEEEKALRLVRQFPQLATMRVPIGDTGGW